MESRYRENAKVVSELLNAGRFVYSPIVHCHPVAISYGLPRDFQFWKDYNYHMLVRSDELLVLCLPGWQESVGVTQEIEWAKAFGLPIAYMGDERG